MMHPRVERRVRFACEECGMDVATKGALVGRRRTCGAGRRLEDVSVGGAELGYPTRTLPVTCGLARLVGEQRRRLTGEREVSGEGVDGGGRAAGVGGIAVGRRCRRHWTWGRGCRWGCG